MAFVDDGTGELSVVVPPEIPTGTVWIDLVLPEGLGDRMPRVDGIPVEFVETDWGLRVPVTADGEGERRISLHASDAS